MKINKAGHLYIGTTILIALAGVNTGNNLVYLTASFLLAYMLISGWLAQLNLRGITVNVRYPDEIFANVTFPLFVHIRNTKKFIPSFFLNVEIGNTGRFLLWLPSGSKKTLTIYTVYPQRGVNYIPAPRISSSFPFNFFTRVRYAGDPSEVIVFPEPRKCSLVEALSVTGTEENARTLDRTYDFEDLVSIRNYLPGDPLKLINWKATAKTGELKVNEFDTGTPGSFILDLVGIPGDYREEVLGCYTYLTLELSRLAIPLGIKTSALFIPPGTGKNHIRKILQILATYDEAETGS